MSTVQINWAWGKKQALSFDIANDVLDFGWFQKGQFTVQDSANGVVIAIPSNDQTYTLEGIKLSQLTMKNVKCLDDGAKKFWQDLLSGDTPAPQPDPVPPGPAPDPDPVPPGPGPAPDPDPVPPGPSGDKWYSMYADLGLWANRTFCTVAKSASVNAITLAFLVYESGQLKWGGCSEPVETFREEANKCKQNGIDVTVSFGGANGVDPSVGYTNVDELVKALQNVLDVMQVKRLDFDIEGAQSANHEANKRRGQALSIIRKNNPNVFISFTLACLPEGLTYDGLDIVRQAKEAGFIPDSINLMAMDYYQGPQDMGQGAIKAAKSTKAQLVSMGLDTVKIGITAMLGVNDSIYEVFTLENAKTVLDFAKETDYISHLGAWSASRDNGNAPYGVANYGSSGLHIEDWAFSKIFRNI